MIDGVRISRQLREILQLADLKDIDGLPKTLPTLQKHYRCQLPLPVVWGKEVRVKAYKAVGFEQQPRGSVLFFDVTELLTNILSYKDLLSYMYFGMAELVDKPRELWHGRAWAESI